MHQWRVNDTLASVHAVEMTSGFWAAQLKAQCAAATGPLILTCTNASNSSQAQHCTFSTATEHCCQLFLELHLYQLALYLLLNIVDDPASDYGTTPIVILAAPSSHFWKCQCF